MHSDGAFCESCEWNAALTVHVIWRYVRCVPDDVGVGSLRAALKRIAGSSASTIDGGAVRGVEEAVRQVREIHADRFTCDTTTAVWGMACAVWVTGVNEGNAGFHAMMSPLVAPCAVCHVAESQ